MTKYYVDEDGAYLGGYDGAEPPEGAIEVPAAPAHAADIWLGEAWQTVTPVPQRITRRQAMQALFINGLIDLVPDLLAAIPDPTVRRMSQIEWYDSNEFERYRPALLSLATALELTSTHLDNLFIQAGAL